ncbi:hypothetical protein [Tepidimicrobium xylanilyticum]|uniref:Uncharacterized protein n=1 Tax=Tepidimicrobium xylanilyticum TaxID=1123352 RepID=A0A1H2XHL8_9FIRM|nr:hypothetical protein [Tepidimicrobium xylanilyticum]GMG97503.1 hypothetical protein EN5CB1_23290 [Tepidimicrobium xylanilyticum]SDW92276.1 hypothetical protein SAMN05660923_01442 [Tepidimicrobium xylanilyticum]
MRIQKDNIAIRSATVDDAIQLNKCGMMVKLWNMQVSLMDWENL